MNQDVIKVLTTCYLFQDMSETDIRQSLSDIDYKIVPFSKDDLHSVCGDICDFVDVLIEGELVVRMMGNSGRMIEVLRLVAGDVIAPCYIFSSNRSIPATIEAFVKSKVLRFSSSSLKSLIDSNALLRWNFIRLLSNIATYMVWRIGFLSLMTVREKVIFFLRSEVKKQHSSTIIINKSRQRIADFFAIQKYSLLRCLATLTSEGIISVNGKKITILDFGRLR